MAPGILSDIPLHSTSPDVGSDNGDHGSPRPLQASGALDKFTYEDTTPVIGREFPNTNIVDDLLNADNADELVRDLAITSEHIRLDFIEIFHH